MNTLEYIVLAVIVILALVLIARIIIKVSKGESPCMFCKSCGDDEKSSCKSCGDDEKSSCKVPPVEDSAKQEDESENKEN
jgi:hypothetical protein